MIDAHLHLYDEAYMDDLDEVIERSKLSGVKFLVNNSDSFEAIESVAKLARLYKGYCYGAFGIHPENANEYKEELLLAKLEEYKDLVVAVGEIGLDYHYEKSSEIVARQKAVFISQIRLAGIKGLPIVVHSRDAAEDTFKILSEEAKDLSVYLHCYSGSLEFAEEYLKAIKNIYFGIGGVITFNNAKTLVKVVERVDLSHLLLETDAPYLSPTPHRGKRNEPAYLNYIIEAISRIKGLSVEDVNEVLDANARKFYRVGE